ncbi:hypothetical protein [uncultured Nocardioides sp.]|uniref:hypothetical protein n=1 Tax=uncultured Nocardioides sp. TaxID=198441 RepID=UPI00262988EC|nr:hypothetical protein [uncultured Nocardioides sp.]
MARCIPEEPTFVTESERQVWERLRGAEITRSSSRRPSALHGLPTLGDVISLRLATGLTASVVVPALLLVGCGEDSADAGASSSAPLTTQPPAEEVVTPPSTPSDDLASAQADVESLAVQLESYYRGGDYPRSLDELLGTLADAGVAPTEDNEVAAYAYDADTVEFTLCVEAPSGAWATYDTEPMTLRQGAESGGCPDLG